MCAAQLKAVDRRFGPAISPDIPVTLRPSLPCPAAAVGAFPDRLHVTRECLCWSPRPGSVTSYGPRLAVTLRSMRWRSARRPQRLHLRLQRGGPSEGPRRLQLVGPSLLRSPCTLSLDEPWRACTCSLVSALNAPGFLNPSALGTRPPSGPLRPTLPLRHPGPT